MSVQLPINLLIICFIFPNQNIARGVSRALEGIEDTIRRRRKKKNHEKGQQRQRQGRERERKGDRVGEKLEADEGIQVEFETDDDIVM